MKQKKKSWPALRSARRAEEIGQASGRIVLGAWLHRGAEQGPQRLSSLLIELLSERLDAPLEAHYGLAGRLLEHLHELVLVFSRDITSALWVGVHTFMKIAGGSVKPAPSAPGA
jgi:hypothetical protein